MKNRRKTKHSSWNRKSQKGRNWLINQKKRNKEEKKKKKEEKKKKKEEKKKKKEEEKKKKKNRIRECLKKREMQWNNN